MMKKLVLILSLISISAFGQVYTSVQDGNFYDLTTWDCTCIPQDGDSLVINHTISMNYGIAYASGQILINSQGTLTDNNTDKDLYINGGSLINNGFLELDGFLLDAGSIENNGTMLLDSLHTRDDVLNTGTITVYDFAHNEFATFTNNGTIEITHNFNNQGTFYSDNLITVSNDFSNCNTQSSDASFTCDGVFCVANDFLNCGTDTLMGNGTIYIGGASSNFGEVKGNLTINTPSGSFSANTGNIDGTVSFGTASCGLSNSVLHENEDWNVYPNPAVNQISLSVKKTNYIIYNIDGKTVMSGRTSSGVVNIDGLQKGSYMIKISDNQNKSSVKRFIKL